MAGKGAESKYTRDKVEIVKRAIAEMEADKELKVFITLPKLSNMCGCTENTMRAWEAKHEEFANVMAKFKQAQKDKMIYGGITGAYNPVFTKFVLSASYGMSEKAAVQVSGDKDEPLEIVVHTE
ncbi:MAG: hypothetical protein J6W31_06045 [Clostridia bacterium]|nr:hypothetical protein [Clostridia bacterium]